MTTPTPEAIEVVAKALYQDWWNRNEYATSPASPAWEAAVPYHREMYLIRATVALTVAAPIIAAQAKAEAQIQALREAAILIAPSSGIGMADGATRADVSKWLNTRANQIEWATIEGKSE